MLSAISYQQENAADSRVRQEGFGVRESGELPLLNPAVFSAALRGESSPSFLPTADS